MASSRIFRNLNSYFDPFVLTRIKQQVPNTANTFEIHSSSYKTSPDRQQVNINASAFVPDIAEDDARSCIGLYARRFFNGNQKSTEPGKLS